MEIAVFSWPEYLEGEPQVTEKLFDSGLTTFHLRKPDSSESDIAGFLNQISRHYHNRIILHQHFALKQKFPVKGIHFSNYCPLKQHQNWLKEKGLIFSASIHSFEEFGGLPNSLHRVYLSPVYDSISKEHHAQNFSEKDLKNFIQRQEENISIFALGGINLYNIQRIKKLGFEGTGILGAIWQLYKLKGAKATCYHFKLLENQVL